MNKKTIDSVLKHPDRDEIVSKLVIGIKPSDVHSWLSAKYTNVNESKFVLTEKGIKSFQDNYLDVYNYIREDMVNMKTALATSSEDQLQLAVKNNPTYKNRMLELVNKEIDIKTTIVTLCTGIEIRLGQIFDSIQNDPDNINTRVDHLLIDYTEALGSALDRYYKYTEAPANQVVNNNITVQVVNQHISVFHDVIKKVLEQMDLDSSLYFLEIFNEEFAKLKPPAENAIPTTEVRLAEVKLLNETINKKINE